MPSGPCISRLPLIVVLVPYLHVTMPVTFHPAPNNGISSVSERDIENVSRTALRYINQGIDPHKSDADSWGTSRPVKVDIPKDEPTIRVIPFKHGFVDTVLQAYNRHHALVVRPDDVWISILTQFSLFINGQGRAEALRRCFVAHDGKRDLVISLIDTPNNADWAAIAQQFTGLIDQNVVDPDMKDWILPNFSTTTENDTVVASIITMAICKTYFNYKTFFMCGIPRVTLVGNREDWLDVFRRAEKLGEYGPEAKAWRALLKPVLARFVRSFDPDYADSEENREFWQQVVHYKPGGSGGPSHLSGWITAFAAFGRDGEWLGVEQQYSIPQISQNIHIQAGFGYIFGQVMARDEESVASQNVCLGIRGQTPYQAVSYRLEVDGVRYHVLREGSVPPAYAEAPVEVQFAGKTWTRMMAAGLVGAEIRNAELENGKQVVDGEIAPIAAWWWYDVD
jgi:hypothetical protein